MGDIHGNSEALKAVLQAARREGAEALAIAGDLVGYYYHPDEVLELIAPWVTYRVRGNHEDMLAGVMADPTRLAGIEAKYGHGLRAAFELLPQEQLKELAGLPESLAFAVGGTRVLLAHGAPWDVDEYIYPDAEAETFERLFAIDADLIILGHTHYRMERRRDDRIVVNPGSVGQPRDRRPGAAWALFDAEARTCEFRTESYDIAQVVDEARARDPQLPYLQQVLVRT